MVMAWVMGMVSGCRAAESRMALAVRASRVQVYWTAYVYTLHFP